MLVWAGILRIIGDSRYWGLGYWDIGYWGIGVLGIGVLGCWDIGILGYWILGCWDIGILGYWILGCWESGGGGIEPVCVGGLGTWDWEQTLPSTMGWLSRLSSYFHSPRAASSQNTANTSNHIVSLSPLNNQQFNPSQCTIHPLPESICNWKGKNQFAIVIDNVLTPEECKKWIHESEANIYSDALVRVRADLEVSMKDFRNSSRCVISDNERSAELWKRICNFIPENVASDRNMHPAFVRDRFSFLRYNPGEYFAPHQDVNFAYPPEHEKYGHISFLTCQVYLNDGFEGGSTRFFTSHDQQEYFDVVPKTGSILIFEHRMLHEGEAVKTGTKYAMRTDVMFSYPME
jgi:predicted 2-oxoglutarate/Fe(II)-dependent dioxygenase YbiX